MGYRLGFVILSLTVIAAACQPKTQEAGGPPIEVPEDPAPDPVEDPVEEKSPPTDPWADFQIDGTYIYSQSGTTSGNPSTYMGHSTTLQLHPVAEGVQRFHLILSTTIGGPGGTYDRWIIEGTYTFADGVVTLTPDPVMTRIYSAEDGSEAKTESEIATDPITVSVTLLETTVEAEIQFTTLGFIDTTVIMIRHLGQG